MTNLCMYIIIAASGRSKRIYFYHTHLLIVRLSVNSCPCGVATTVTEWHYFDHMEGFYCRQGNQVIQSGALHDIKQGN